MLELRSLMSILAPYMGDMIPNVPRRPVKRSHCRPSNETPDSRPAQRRRRQIARGMLQVSPADLYRHRNKRAADDDTGRPVKPHRSGRYRPYWEGDAISQQT